jgi:hypothetical protein
VCCTCLGTQNLKRCSKCRKEHYCSKKCQLFAWKHWHKAVCGTGNEHVRDQWKIQVELREAIGHDNVSKGFGLFAGTKFERGEVIFCESPLLRITPESPMAKILDVSNLRKDLLQQLDLWMSGTEYNQENILTEMRTYTENIRETIKKRGSELKRDFINELYVEATAIEDEMKYFSEPITTTGMKIDALKSVERTFDAMNAAIMRMMTEFYHLAKMNTSEEDFSYLCSLSVPPEYASRSKEHKFWFIWKTNRFQISVPLPDEPEDVAMFKYASRINHSCVRPNAIYVWNEERGEMVFVATRPIEKGQEITINYAPWFENFYTGDPEGVLARLKDQFHFECACGTCMLLADYPPNVVAVLSRTLQESSKEMLASGLAVTKQFIETNLLFLVRKLELPEDELVLQLMHAFVLVNYGKGKNARSDAVEWIKSIYAERIGPVMSEKAVEWIIEHI